MEFLEAAGISSEEHDCGNPRKELRPRGVVPQDTLPPLKWLNKTRAALALGLPGLSWTLTRTLPLKSAETVAHAPINPAAAPSQWFGMSSLPCFGASKETASWGDCEKPPPAC